MIEIIFDRIPAKTIVSIFVISIVYSYFRGFEASMVVFFICMGGLGAKSLMSHVKGKDET